MWLAVSCILVRLDRGERWGLGLPGGRFCSLAEEGKGTVLQCGEGVDRERWVSRQSYKKAEESEWRFPWTRCAQGVLLGQGDVECLRVLSIPGWWPESNPGNPQKGQGTDSLNFPLTPKCQGVSVCLTPTSVIMIIIIFWKDSWK